MIVCSFQRSVRRWPSSMHLMSRSFSNAESDTFNSVDPKITTRIINWYPGHIAKAERELSEYLRKVDVVIEVRDARIPLATTHPSVPKWVGSKPLIIAIARLDQVSNKALAEWKEYYSKNPAYAERPDARVFFIDGKTGAGVGGIKKQALKASAKLNAKRVSRGILPRAVRAAIIGFPNVGKSTLINRLLGRKLANAQNKPGVTRQLQWVRIGGLQGASQADNIELLDSPGIIPARQFDQEVAVKLAICNDIGEASYDRVVVAANMIDLLNRLYRKAPQYVNLKKILERYELPLLEMTGDDAVQKLAEKFYRGNDISAADRLLGDFRKGLFGGGSLECVLDAPVYENFRFDRSDDDGFALPSTAVTDYDIHDMPPVEKSKTQKKAERKVVLAKDGETFKYDGGIESIEALDPEDLKKFQTEIALEEERQQRKELKKALAKQMYDASKGANGNSATVETKKSQSDLSPKEIGKGGHEDW